MPWPVDSSPTSRPRARAPRGPVDARPRSTPAQPRSPGRLGRRRWLALWLPGGVLLACVGPPQPTSLVLELEGMVCDACAAGIREALLRVDGVLEARASFAEQRAWITYDARRVDAEAIVRATERLGFRARVVGPADER